MDAGHSPWVLGTAREGCSQPGLCWAGGFSPQSEGKNRLMHNTYVQNHTGIHQTWPRKVSGIAKQW